MPDLQTWAAVAEIVGVATVVGGILFAIIQLRHLRVQRSDTAAMELVRAVHDKSYEENWPIVLALPEGITLDELRAREDGAEEAAMGVQYHFETIGVLVYHGAIPLTMFDHLSGGVCRSSWQILRRYVEDYRRDTGLINFAEWFQWLVERLEEYPEPCKSTGAHEYHRVWKP